jgi:hypothetical protein
MTAEEKTVAANLKIRIRPRMTAEKNPGCGYGR